MAATIRRAAAVAAVAVAATAVAAPAQNVAAKATSHKDTHMQPAQVWLPITIREALTVIYVGGLRPITTIAALSVNENKAYTPLQSNVKRISS